MALHEYMRVPFLGFVAEFRCSTADPFLSVAFQALGFIEEHDSIE